MILPVSLLTSSFILFQILTASSNKNKKSKLKSKNELNQKEIERVNRRDSTNCESQQFVSEEYTRSYKAERVGPYQIVYMDKKIFSVPESDYFPKQAKQETRERDSRSDSKNKSNSGSKKKNAYFNNAADSVSENSSVADESPRVRPTVTQRNAQYSDFTSGKCSVIIHHLGNKLGDFDHVNYEDKSDVLGDVIRKADFSTTHNDNYDGFSTFSKKESNQFLCRNESIHPMRTFNKENEVDPYAPRYASDVATSQKEMESHIGRRIGRDSKTKIFQNRNSFSSVNDGCLIC